MAGGADGWVTGAVGGSVWRLGEWAVLGWHAPCLSCQYCLNVSRPLIYCAALLHNQPFMLPMCAVLCFAVPGVLRCCLCCAG